MVPEDALIVLEDVLSVPEEAQLVLEDVLSVLEDVQLVLEDVQSVLEDVQLVLKEEEAEEDVHIHFQVVLHTQTLHILLILDRYQETVTKTVHARFLRGDIIEDPDIRQ